MIKIKSLNEQMHETLEDFRKEVKKYLTHQKTSNGRPYTEALIESANRKCAKTLISLFPIEIKRAIMLYHPTDIAFNKAEHISFSNPYITISYEGTGEDWKDYTGGYLVISPIDFKVTECVGDVATFVKLMIK